MKCLLLLLISFNCFAYLPSPPVPGHLCTSNDPDFDEYRYEEQIAHCKRHVSTRRKSAICERDGVYDRTNFTVDHIISLGIGGSNHDDNLWCQHKSINVTREEGQIYRALRAGLITQSEAIEEMLRLKF